MSQPLPDVRPGQVWADADPRSEGRTVRVLSVADGYARVVVLTLGKSAISGAGRVHKIKVTRFRTRQTGYVMLADAPVAPSAS